MNKNDSIVFGTSKINYYIFYSPRRKNVSISVGPDKKVEVIAPANLTMEAIKEVVKRKADWILKKLDWFNHIKQLDASKEYVNGEIFLYMGRQYRLKIRSVEIESSIKLKGKYFEATVSKNMPQERKHQVIRDLLWKWYIEHTENKLTEKCTNILANFKLTLLLLLLNLKQSVGEAAQRLISSELIFR